MTITQQPSKLAHIQIHFEQQLNQLMANISPPAQLKAAIQHSLLAPGKRIRPRLIYAIGLALNASLAELDGAAMAIECMHCYSLIHDDLPAMDDADTRRGRPSRPDRPGEHSRQGSDYHNIADRPPSSKMISPSSRIHQGSRSNVKTLSFPNSSTIAR